MQGYVLAHPREMGDDTVRIAVLTEPGEEVPPAELFEELTNELVRKIRERREERRERFDEFITRIETTAEEVVLYIEHHADFWALIERLKNIVASIVRNFDERRYARAAA